MEDLFITSKRERRILEKSREKDNDPIELSNNHGYGDLSGE